MTCPALPARICDRRPPTPRGSRRSVCAGPLQAGWMLLTALLLSLASLGCSLAEGDAEADSPKDGHDRPANRLARETSPYLLAHAHNPVDWYPWGPEALEKARKEDKPIFLSIGYSSCHWCHVMEKEVFSNAEIARYMNENFVNVKVDREERPDLDDIYMTALQLYFEAVGSPQSGGWPLSIFLTSDGRPLGGGTYFPPRDEDGRTGFPTLMKNVAAAWRDHRKQMETNADILADAVRATMRPKARLQSVELDRSLVAPVVKSLESSYDPEYGGFGFSERNPDRPKFPVPTKLALLQYEAHRHGGEQEGKMLYHTLDRMAAGGIHDHVGGGFHRYSTDRYWRVPHFEKMLYDNAQLADVYAEAYRHTNQHHYRAVAERTIEFVLRELTDAQGAFYSALDADSEGAEGRYYVWTDAELGEVLTEDELAVCRVVYGTGGPGNFENAHVLEMQCSLDEAAGALKRPALELERQIGEIRRKLLAARGRRTAPARDDKILTSWNGLMIRALARSGVIFGEAQYVGAAERAAEFVLTSLRDENGRLYRSYRANQARHPAYLDDYAFLVDGLLALHLATGKEKWANAARRLTEQQLELFWDDEGKGCYYTADDHEALLARTRNAFDSVLPSGNSVTVRNLLRLASIAREPNYRDRARESLELFAPAISESPGGLAGLALALSEYLDTDAPAEGAVAPAAGEEEPAAGNVRLGIAPDGPVVLAEGRQAPRQAAGAAGRKEARKPEYVTMKAWLSVDRLPPGSTCKVLVQLDVADGWHIGANPARDEFDLPTELTVESALGTELTKVRYPAADPPAAAGKDAGSPGETEGEEPPPRFYTGRVQILGLLEVPADAAGRKEELKLEVTCQPCNDRKCLAPQTLTLTLPVAVARRGEAVRSINAELFAPPKKKPPPRR